MMRANTQDATRSPRASYWTKITVGALLLVATSEFFAAQIIAQLAWPSYSVSQYDISALGVTECGPYTNGSGGLTFYACSPLHMVMNAGFILLGVLTIAGVLLTRSIWPQRRLTSVGVALVAVSGLGAALSGLFPANVNLGFHVLGALLNFLTASVGLLLLGIGARKQNGRLAAWSIALGLTTIAGLILYNSQNFLGLGPGGMERVIGYPSVVWDIGLGAALLFQRRAIVK
ncbi:MAG TPA: DUF998 domain-containing protein [Ktedonobacterales bacterium]|jgi:hypothetical membrane protein|nr:DUF998 domain-containing protein [Ktedonobacterales bacterium]